LLFSSCTVFEPSCCDGSELNLFASLAYKLFLLLLYMVFLVTGLAS
jgi:hypothetical protein